MLYLLNFIVAMWILVAAMMFIVCSVIFVEFVRCLFKKYKK
jgi:hypothetical protein